MIPLLLACQLPPDLNVEAHPADLHAVELSVSTPSAVSCETEDDVLPTVMVQESYLLRGLLAGKTYRCTATDAEGRRSRAVPVETETLPDALPRPDGVIEGEGWHLVNTSRTDVPLSFGWLLILDGDGRVRWHYRGTGFADDLDATWMGDRILVGGRDVPPAILDLDGVPLWTAPNPMVSPYEVEDAWNHDVGLSADGADLLGLTRELDSNNQLGFIVKQISISDNSLRWSWSSTVDGAGQLLPGPESDPYHANSVWDLGDAVLVSLRAQSTIIKIDKTTRQVVWKMGIGGDFMLLEADGTPATADRWFDSQHDAKLIGNQLSVFDNHVAIPGPSRALILSVDESLKTARIQEEWSLAVEGHPWQAFAWGGLDPLPDGSLSIAYGNFGNDNQPPSALFTVEAGEIQWQAEFARGVGIYRSDWIPDFPPAQ